jgi:hypothetical protein
MRNVPFTALNALDASASKTSAAIDASQLIAASVQVIMTGSSPTGTVKVQASNDAPQAGNLPYAPTNWTDVASLTVSVSAATSYLIPKFDCAYRWIRVVYTFTSGTGTVTAEVNAIGF